MSGDQGTVNGEQCAEGTLPPPFAAAPPFSTLPFAERKHIVATLWSQTPFAVRHSLFTCEALLRITVCDPSCGSGHFLLAAARRLAEKLAELRAPDGAVRPDDYRHALREVASRCLYGVDINPMAVELCRVALWLETVDPGKPLGFLNHHIRTGNSLLGTTPDLIAAGLPDDTFTAIEGDDKPACAELKKRNKKEREGFGPLFEKEEQTIRDRLRQAATQIEAMDDSQPAALQQKEAAFTTSETAPEYRHAKLLADLWCAAFVIKKHYPASGSAGSQIADAKSQIGSSEPSEARQTADGSPQGSEAHQIPNPSSQIAQPTQDELFGHPTPAPAPKAAKKPKLETSNLKLGTPSGITTAHLRDFVQGKPLPADLQAEVEALARQYSFFHWHLAFPQVFDQGGFACILGNPPWERIQVEALQFFASRRPEFADMNRSQREKAIEDLSSSDQGVFGEWIETRRKELGSTAFLKASRRFPFSTEKNINSYAVFTELALGLVHSSGRCGLITQSGIATDDIMKPLFRHLVSTQRLVSLFDFENREKIFPSVHPQLKFCLITVSGSDVPTSSAEFIFYATRVSDLDDSWRRFSLSNEEIQTLNPNTQTCPIFRSGEAAALCLFLYRRVPVLMTEEGPSQNRWGAAIRRMFDMAYDSHLFRAQIPLPQIPGSTLVDTEDPELLRLYEAKFIHQFDHRFATFNHSIQSDNDCADMPDLAKKDPVSKVVPRYWVTSEDRRRKMEATGWNRQWIVAFREITNTTNERTSICAVIPGVGVGHTCYTITFDKQLHVSVPAFLANANSFIFDWAARQKVAGTHLSVFILKQLPFLPPATYAQPCPWANDPKSKITDPPSLRDWLLPRVLELTYTAWDLEAFASDCGWSGPPFRWDEERRFLLRCELDAAFFHLYLGPQSEWQQQPEALTRAFPTPRHAVSYIMDTFPIVKRKDETKHGHYRTKETILQIYDALGEAMQTGQPYQTLLNPPPADPACCHPPRIKA